MKVIDLSPRGNLYSSSISTPSVPEAGPPLAILSAHRALGNLSRCLNHAHRAHPSRLRDWLSYRREVAKWGQCHAEKQKAEALALPKDDATRAQKLRAVQSTLRKLQGYERCGVFTTYRRCQSCGEGRPGSGVHLGVHKAPKPETEIYPCGARVCEMCGSVRSRALTKKLHQKICQMDLVDNYILMQITFTFAHDPSDKRSYEISAIRERMNAMLFATKALWDPKRHLKRHIKGGLKHESAAYTVKYELSPNAFMHAHALYYGPFRPKDDIEAILREAYDKAGFTSITKIANYQELLAYRELQSVPRASWTAAQQHLNATIGKSIRETCKYTTKGPSPLDEQYLAGDRRERVDPELAAKWELALYGLHTMRSYGAFRGPVLDDVDVASELENEIRSQKNDDHIQCKCGKIGKLKNEVTGEVYAWEDATMPTYKWVHCCHAVGEKAFPWSRWKPLTPSDGS